jgi:iron complex outermembrane receptor protein
LFVFAGVAQEKYSLSGRVLDENGSGMPGVVLHIDQCEQHVTTGKNGRFQVFDLDSGQVLVHAHFLGYDIFSDTIFIDRNIRNYSIKMIPMSYDLDGVEISGNNEALRKREQTLSVQTVDDRFIAENLDADIMKTLSRLPGVSSIDIGSGQSKPVIRGLSFNRVVVAESGIKHEAQQWGVDHGLEIDQYNVANVEVIKGPASLMYGSDAIGGVVRIDPFVVPPGEGVTGDVTLTGKTNNNLLGVSASTMIRKTNRFLHVRLTGITHGDYRVPVDTVTYNTYDFALKDNYLRNTAGRELNAFVAGGFSGKWGRTQVSVGNYYRKSGFYADAHGFEIRNSDIDYDARNRDIDLPYQEVNHIKVISNTKFLFNDHKMDVGLSYQNNHRREYAEPTEHGYRPLPPNSLEREFNKDVFSANVAMNHFFGEGHAMTSGVNLEYQNNRIGGWGFIIPAFQRFTAGAFIYDRLKLTEKISANAGVRFDYGRISLEPYYDWYQSPVFDNNGNIVGEDYMQRSPALTKDFTALTGSVGFNYTSGIFTGKVNFGRSFRLPDARELGADGVNYHMFRQELGDSTLTAETAWQADFSMEFDLDKTRLSFSGFYSWFPNYIYLNPTSEFSDETGLQIFRFVQNEVVRWGGEIAVDQKISDHFTVNLTGEYLYSEQLSGEKKGFGLAFSPPVSALAGLTWTPELWSDVLSGTYFTLETKVTGEQNRVVPPENPTDGYAILNLLAGTNLKLADENFEAYFQINNLLNKTYFNHTSYYRLINIPEPGINVQMTLKWKF